jgi:tripartite-type tricarboxylate transporter receptor subunit TctC
MSAQLSAILHKLVWIARWTATISLSAAFAATCANADSVATFYKSKELILVVGFSPSGGYDIYARLLARHIGRHIPGSPRVAVQNMPGAGSLRAANYLYTPAPRDGTTIGMFSRNMPMIGVLGVRANIEFKPDNFTWLGSPSSFRNDAHILIVRKDAPVKSIEEARRPDLPGLVLGAIAEGGTGNDVPIILRDTIGLHVKQIVGFPDSAATFAAVEKAEIQGRTVDLSLIKSAKSEWLRPDSALHVLVQFARATRHPEFADVPTARELAKNEAARAIIELAEVPYVLSRPVAAPPDVPNDRAGALKKAFLAVNSDPEYLDDATRLGIDISPIGSDGVLRAINQIASAPPDLLDYLRKLFAETKGGG